MADQLLGWLQQAGFRGQALRTAYAIAKRESGGRPQAYNPNRQTGDQSYGLFQINMLGNLGPARRKQYGLASNEALFDPLTNARVAYRMSGGGKDFGPWGVGPNAYRKTAPLNYAGVPGGGGAATPMAAPPVQGVSPLMAGAPRRPQRSLLAPMLMSASGMSDPRAQTRALMGALLADTRRTRDVSQEPPDPYVPPKGGSAPPAGKLTGGGFLQQALGGVSYNNLGGPQAHAGRPLGNWQSDQAWDLGVPVGTPVYATSDGVIGPNVGVQSSRPQDGARLTLQASDNQYWYGHLSRIMVKPGQRVRRGDLIGYSGASQNKVAHLHLGVQNL